MGITESSGRGVGWSTVDSLAPTVSVDESEQDDIVRLIAELCDTPIALVTNLSGDRQYFTAAVGTDLADMPVNHALCVHALAEGDLLVIPDLSTDPRTRNNPIVTGEPAVRFYAGMPFHVDGIATGTLCVLDTVARPEGLSPVQRQTLLRLGRQVAITMELRRLLAERDVATARIADTERELSGGERRWQRMFENVGDGFALGEVIRDDAGRVTDWRYIDANPAWLALAGVDRRAMLETTGRTLDADAPARWTHDLDRLLADGVPVVFNHHARTLGHWFRGRAFRIEGDRFGIILHETTEEVAAAARQTALIQLGDALRDCHDVADVTRVASRLVGEAMDVARAGFGRIDAALRHIDIAPDWATDGVESIAGRYRFAEFGELADGLIGGDPLVIDNVRTDPRVAGRTDVLARVGIGSGGLVAMPVRRDGQVVAVFLVHAAAARSWTPEELGFLRKVADRVEVGVVQVEAERQQSLLVHELAHRLKNTLSMVQAIASQTLRGSIDRAPLDAFERRLQTLGMAHDVLVDRNWTGADMAATIRRVLGVFGCEDRFVLTGPEVALGARATLALALILHELGTNAVKYGALSNATGMVALDWQQSDGGRLTLAWQERGGPPVTPPTRRGFGSKLLQMGLAGTGGSAVHYAADGVRAVMHADLAELTGG
jgi:two-component sensor histidine kinase